jgi:hypothetical protein
MEITFKYFRSNYPTDIPLIDGACVRFDDSVEWEVVGYDSAKKRLVGKYDDVIAGFNLCDVTPIYGNDGIRISNIDISENV